MNYRITAASVAAWDEIFCGLLLLPLALLPLDLLLTKALVARYQFSLPPVIPFAKTEQ